MLRNLNQNRTAGRICGTPYVGALGAEIPTGFAFPSLLANDIDSGYPSRRYSAQILTWPAGVLMRVGERGEVSLTALDGVSAPADGVYSGTQRVRKYDPGQGLVYNDTGSYSITIGSVAPAEPTVTDVTISPAAASVTGGGTLVFTPTVIGLNNPPQDVTYSFTAGSMIGNAYTAPPAGPSIAQYQVTATSNFNPSKSATATITVPAAGTVTVTDSDFLAWLESDDAIPNILIETWALVGGVATPFYWSTCGYSTEGTASPTHYEPVLSRGIAFHEALSIGSGASVAASVLDVDNTDGIHEDWTAYTWSNQLVYEYVGDLRWNRADYRRVSKGVSAGLVRKDDRTLALHLRDMTQRLNVPLSEHKLGGTGTNQDQIFPLAFGELPNVGGLLTNAPASLERSFHDGAIKAFGEVRAAGLPVAVTENLATGRCEPTEDPGSAVITASIQGDNYGGVFRKTIAAIIQRIVTGYGSASDRYTDADIDLANFAAFDAAHQQLVGHYVDARENLYAACDFLARSVGAQLVPTADGLLQLIQIALPASGTSMDIRPEHLVGPLRPVQHIDPIAASKIGFCRNHTVQETVAGGVPAALAEMFKTEWLTATAVNAAASAALNLDADPVQQRNTALMRRVDADAEAARDLALWGPGRDIYEFDGLAPLLMLKIGQPVTVYDELFGMQAGRPGQILEILDRDWDARRVTGRILV